MVAADVVEEVRYCLKYCEIPPLIYHFIYSVALSADHRCVWGPCGNWVDWLSCLWCKLLLSSGVRVHYTAGRSSFPPRWPEPPGPHFHVLKAEEYKRKSKSFSSYCTSLKLNATKENLWFIWNDKAFIASCLLWSNCKPTEKYESPWKLDSKSLANQQWNMWLNNC